MRLPEQKEHIFPTEAMCVHKTHMEKFWIFRCSPQTDFGVGWEVINPRSKVGTFHLFVFGSTGNFNWLFHYCQAIINQ